MLVDTQYEKTRIDVPQACPLTPMLSNHHSKAPNPEAWLDMDESIRIQSVPDSHSAVQKEFEEGADKLHAVINAIVENKIALGTEPIPSIIEKSMRRGLGRHESIHAVGAVLSEVIYNLMDHGSNFNIKKYRSRLEKLTAKRWRKAQWRLLL